MSELSRRNKHLHAALRDRHGLRLRAFCTNPPSASCLLHCFAHIWINNDSSCVKTHFRVLQMHTLALADKHHLNLTTPLSDDHLTIKLVNHGPLLLECILGFIISIIETVLAAGPFIYRQKNGLFAHYYPWTFTSGTVLGTFCIQRLCPYWSSCNMDVPLCCCHHS